MSNATPIADMQRLVSLLADPGGTVTSELEFTRDPSERDVITGNAATTATMTCQRCLQPMQVTLEADIELAVVADEMQAGSPTGDMEPLVSANGEVSPLALVEDELILALPVVPMHGPGTRCEVPAEAIPSGTARPNPFAVLKSLKRE